MILGNYGLVEPRLFPLLLFHVPFFSDLFPEPGNFF